MFKVKKYLQKLTLPILCIIFLFVSISSIVKADINAETKTTVVDVTRLQAFVERGIDYIKKAGPSKAYKEFSKRGGQFNQGELYLFVYDYKGNCLAIGFMQNRIGKNFINELDAYGTPVVKMIVLLAKTGGGFISYYWPSPMDNSIRFKTSYVKPIGNNTLIGSGLYEVLEVPKSQLVKLEELKAFVNSGIAFFQEHGAEKAYKTFADTKGKFRIGGMYLFVFDYNGRVLSHGANQELIGKNLYSAKGEFGTPYVQWFIATAKSGEGVVSYYALDPLSQHVKLRTSYIKSLNKSVFIGGEVVGE